MTIRFSAPQVKLKDASMSDQPFKAFSWRGEFFLIDTLGPV